MESTVLREFLVRLGFDLDKAGARAMDATVNATTRNIMRLGLAATAAAAAVTVAVTKISEDLDALYFASQRIGASVGNIQAFSYAISQLGGTVAGATGSLENLARFVRNSPGALGLIQSLGVRTADENGRARDMVDIMADLGTVLRRMPYYQANAYASVLGIDETTLMALRNGTEEFADEYRMLLRKAGLDTDKAAKSANSYMKELRGINAAVTVMVQKFSSLLSDRMAAGARRLREYFVANFDRIAGAIGTVIDVVGRIVDAVARVFGRAVDIVADLVRWFLQLNPLMLDMVKVVGLVAAGWIALNAAISLSPVGRVIALATALLALYDDYRTWAEGGKALFDWGQWGDEIQLVTDIVDGLANAIKSAFDWLTTLGRKFADTRLGELVGEGLGRLLDFVAGRKPGTGIAAAPGATGAARAPAAAPRLNTEGAMRFFQSAGWTREQAAGIVANLKAESALDPSAVGDGGKAYGLAQWHPARQANFEKWAGKPIQKSTAEEQLAFVHYELTQGAERRAGEALRATRSADLAAEVVSTQYERPADREGEAAKRGAAAVTIAQTTNITVNGAGPETAQEIAGLQKDVNQQIVRNTRGAVR